MMTDVHFVCEDKIIIMVNISTKILPLGAWTQDQDPNPKTSSKNKKQIPPLLSSALSPPSLRRCGRRVVWFLEFFFRRSSLLRYYFNKRESVFVFLSSAELH